MSRLGVTVLGSGSSGNAMVVQRESEAILVDAGFTAKELTARLRTAGIEPGMLRAILVTHEHGDHCRGVRVLSRQLNIPVYATGETARAIQAQEEGKLGPVQVFAAGSSFDLCGFRIRSFSISHDTVDPVGFVIANGAFKLGVATDLGVATSLVEQVLRDCDILALESNHDIQMVYNSNRPAYNKQRVLGNRGHLSNRASMELLRKILHPKTRHLILAHISRECNRHDLVARCARECLDGLGRQDLQAVLASQDTPLGTAWAD